jgi:hypothetical protein
MTRIVMVAGSLPAQVESTQEGALEKTPAATILA